MGWATFGLFFTNSSGHSGFDKRKKTKDLASQNKDQSYIKVALSARLGIIKYLKKPHTLVNQGCQMAYFQKCQFWYLLGGLGLKNLVYCLVILNFITILAYFMAIWYFVDILVYYFSFWFSVQRKIWQPLSKTPKQLFTTMFWVINPISTTGVGFSLKSPSKNIGIYP
jgi:hypothetical protein